MSTKTTIAHGPGWHLYYDFTNDGVHLELEDLQLEERELSFDYDAGPRMLRVELPRVVLEAIANTRKAWEAAYDEEETWEAAYDEEEDND